MRILTPTLDVWTLSVQELHWTLQNNQITQGQDKGPDMTWPYLLLFLFKVLSFFCIKNSIRTLLLRLLSMIWRLYMFSIIFGIIPTHDDIHRFLLAAPIEACPAERWCKRYPYENGTAKKEVYIILIPGRFYSLYLHQSRMWKRWRWLKKLPGNFQDDNRPLHVAYGFHFRILAFWRGRTLFAALGGGISASCSLAVINVRLAGTTSESCQKSLLLYVH